MKSLLTLVITGSLAFGSLISIPAQDQEETSLEPEYSISEIMERAHKGRDALGRKVQKGEASAEEKTELLRLYVDLLDNDPPQGDKETWEKLCKDIIVATSRIIIDQEGAADEFKSAINCKACHDEYKPK